MTKKYTLKEIEWVLKRTHLSSYLACTIPTHLLKRELKEAVIMTLEGEI